MVHKPQWQQKDTWTRTSLTKEVTNMVEVTAQNFEQEVKSETDKLVLVDFWSEKCEKCMALMPEVEELEKKYADKVKFAKIDAAKDRRFCWSLKVMSLPTSSCTRTAKRWTRLHRM